MGTLYLRYSSIIAGLLCLLVAGYCFLHFSSPLLLKQPMISSADGYSRLVEGISTYFHPDSHGYIWLPGHRETLALFIALNPTHAEFQSRFLSWIILPIVSSITFLFVFLRTKKFSISLIAAAFYLVNPLTINLSTQTLSENVWLLFISISILLLSQKSKKLWFIGIIFWILSQTVRYESWYLSPIILLIFYGFHKNIKATVIFAVVCIIFPIYWLLTTYFYTGNIFYYWHEKMFQASKGPPDIYYHLIPSLQAWWLPLQYIISIPVISVFLICSIFQIKQKNYLSLLAISTFFLLVLQVYLGTMEYFPARYLSIVPFATIIVIFTVIGKSKYFLPETLIIILLLSIEATHLPTNLKQIGESPLPETLSLAKTVNSSPQENTCYIYLYDIDNYSYSEVSLPYLINKIDQTYLVLASKMDLLSTLPTNCIYIIDKGFSNTVHPKFVPYIANPIFKNSHYILANPNIIP